MGKIIDPSSVWRHPAGERRELAVGKSKSGMTRLLYSALVTLLMSQPLHGLSIVYPPPEVTMSQAESVLVGHLAKTEDLWRLRVIRVLKGPFAPGDLLTVYPAFAPPNHRIPERTLNLVDGRDVVFSGAWDKDSRLLVPAGAYGAVLPYDVNPEHLPAKSFLEVVRFAENHLKITPAPEDPVPPEWTAPLPVTPRQAWVRKPVAASSISGPPPDWDSLQNSPAPAMPDPFHFQAEPSEPPADGTVRREPPSWIAFREGAAQGGIWGLVPAIGILLWMRGTERRNLPSRPEL